MNRFLLFLAVLTVGATAAGEGVTRPADIPVEKFAQLPIMRDAELSPDGKYLAYIRPIKGRSNIVIQNLVDGGQPVAVPPTNDQHYEWLHWANDNRLVFVVSAMRKRARGTLETKETRLWAIDADGSNLVHIVKPSTVAKTGSKLGRELPHAQVQGDIVHWLPDEPNHILLAVDGDHNAADEVRKIDVRNGDFDEIRSDYDGIQNWLTDEVGRLRLGWGYRGSKFRVLSNRNEGKWRSAESAAWRNEGYFPAVFTESPDVAYMYGSNDAGFATVETVNIETGEVVDVLFDKKGVEAGNIVVDPVSQKSIGVAYTEHLPAIEYFDEEMSALQRSIDGVLPGKSNRIVSMTGDRRQVLIRSASDTDPGTYSFLDRDKGSLSQIAEVMPGLNPTLMSPVEPVSYVARDGLTIPAYITYPLGLPREDLKFIVMPHGGPANRDDQSFWYLAQFLASRGYAIFQPNFRGSTGYGRKFQRLGRKEWGGKMQEDVTDGARWLIEQGLADADNMCIVGWSYGGYSAAMGAIQTPDLYQCAASINGVLDLPRLIHNDKQYIGGSVWTRHMGLEDTKAQSVSPYHQAERITVPMLIIQAEDDARVEVAQGRRMARRLEKLKSPVTYVEVELGGHSMTNEPARAKVLRSLEVFLADNLGSD